MPSEHVHPSSKFRRRAGIAALFVALGTTLAVLAFAIQNWTALAKARKLKNPFPPSTEALVAGMHVYTNQCQSCHGKYGDGKGEKASELSVAPGDFTDASKINSMTDGELFWQITKGRRPMPAFADKLNEEQRWQLVDYIRTFARKPTTSHSAPREYEAILPDQKLPLDLLQFRKSF